MDEDLNKLVGSEGYDKIGGKVEGEGKRREMGNQFQLHTHP